MSIADRPLLEAFVVDNGELLVHERVDTLIDMLTKVIIMLCEHVND